MLRREGDETTVQRRAGKPAVDNASLVTVRFIRTDTRGSSSRPGERFSTKRPDTFTQTRCFAQLQTSCSQAADHTLSLVSGGRARRYHIDCCKSLLSSGQDHPRFLQINTDVRSLGLPLSIQGQAHPEPEL